MKELSKNCQTCIDCIEYCEQQPIGNPPGCGTGFCGSCGFIPRPVEPKVETEAQVIEGLEEVIYPETLQLITDDRHKQITILESKIIRLEVENAKLKKQLKGASI